jgi:predicted Zn finger-like uncharacterized protein
MVVQCPKCKTKYEVADMDVPAGGCAVQCLECSNVFTIYREPLDIKLTPYREKESEPSVSEAKEILKSSIESGKETLVEEKPVKEPAPLTDNPEKMKQHRKAERLGKSLVKDIYLYHKDKVEQGRRNGTLVQLLGEEIKKSWKFYKKQVDPGILQEKNYFKDALNEIIAEGKEVFK